MNDRIEIPKTQFVTLLDSVMQWAACSSFLPGEVPPPEWIEPDPESCQHWLEAVTVMRAADTAIERVYVQQRIADASGDGAARSAREAHRAEIARVVDDFCGTPPRLPAPWPPSRVPLKNEGLRATTLLALAGRFHAAAGRMEDHALAPELGIGADRLFEVGLGRLA
ncbi:hypothetical protein OG689_35745 [Kitasatospora sp. NBC_00240]|uniref:hypothetical protein n=1 Tax=Kitasatospora sp. NBC_00240 TaxID=2903567 RepID=UPI00224E9F68|nr:hypothetical protein [Kitasatospora sp. NBC_00240]MCX5214555.1 hypothetical protein [Kitasatospora sp. NBC_00240]